MPLVERSAASGPANNIYYRTYVNEESYFIIRIDAFGDRSISNNLQISEYTYDNDGRQSPEKLLLSPMGPWPIMVSTSFFFFHKSRAS